MIQLFIRFGAICSSFLAIYETRCYAMSNLSEPKKKEVCKLEMPIERIGNEDMKKILIQLAGAVMEVGYALKCLIVVMFSLVSFPLRRIGELCTPMYQNIVQ